MSIPEKTFQTIKDELLDLGKIRIAASFYCDPSIPIRHATDEERKLRTIETHRGPGEREILIVLNGECDYLLENHIYHLAPGCALLFDVGESHQWCYPADTPPGRHLWIHIMPEHVIYMIVSVVGSKYSTLPTLSSCPHYDPYGQKMLVDAWDRTKNHAAGREYLTELALMLALRAAQVVRFYNFAVEYDGYNAGKRNLLRIKKVVEYIDAQCGKNCSINMLAKIAGCGRNTLINNFRRYNGCSVLEYINRQRIRRYKSLLRPSYIAKESCPLKVCAQELGFSSPQAFARWRKQHIADDRPETGRRKPHAPGANL